MWYKHIAAANAAAGFRIFFGVHVSPIATHALIHFIAGVVFCSQPAMLPSSAVVSVMERFLV